MDPRIKNKIKAYIDREAHASVESLQYNEKNKLLDNQPEQLKAYKESIKTRLAIAFFLSQIIKD